MEHIFLVDRRPDHLALRGIRFYARPKILARKCDFDDRSQAGEL